MGKLNVPDAYLLGHKKMSKFVVGKRHYPRLDKIVGF
jgi:hypothetical protein